MPTLKEDIRALSWRKLGLVIDPERLSTPWMQTHAALPVAVPLDGNVYRVYCAGRDAEGRAQIGTVDVDIAGPEVVAVSEEAVLGFGPLGAFDDRGVLPASLVEFSGRILLFYTGVMLGKTVPFYYAVGAAASTDGGRTFEKISAAPVLDRNAVDPYLTASPYVFAENGKLRMWYTSGVRWSMENGAPKHYYLLKYAESANGVAWNRDGSPAIDFAGGDYAISRPSVIRDSNVYRMWYAHRGEAYRIGYAESADGITWERRDGEAGIDVSASGWDSEMMCYPHVFDRAGRRYMFYNGNGFGRTGAGLAVLED